jgi:hypothetical protein
MATGNILAEGNTDKLKLLTITWDPANISGTNTTSEQTLTVPGVAVGDFVVVTKPTLSAGVGIVNARVSAANTVAVQWVNATGSAVNPGSEAYLVLVMRPDATLNAF